MLDLQLFVLLLNPAVSDVQICMKYSKELRVLFGALLIIQATCSKIACFNALLYNHEKIQTCLPSRNI